MLNMKRKALYTLSERSEEAKSEKKDRPQAVFCFIVFARA